MQFIEVLERTVKERITQQLEDGSFPSGHNGPYYDPETPIRNTAHWVFILCKLYEVSKNESHLISLRKAVNYLMNNNNLNDRASYKCRNKEGKDKCNGLIGQAWVIEAMVLASSILDDEKCYKLAEDLYLLHPWNEMFKVWNRVEVDGTILSPDPTFNHQLWFAATASLLYKTPDAINASYDFLSFGLTKLELYNDGIIYHDSLIGEHRKLVPDDLRKVPGHVKKRFKNKLKKSSLRHKSIGYHAFNLYALAMLSQVHTDHPFWNSKKLKQMIEVTYTDAFKNSLNANNYGYPYNPVGLEMAFVSSVFLPDSKNEIQTWFNKQMAITGSIENFEITTRSSQDPLTSEARIYEFLRVSNWDKIELI